MGATLLTTYACAPCGAISDVTLTDLWAGPDDANAETRDGILKLRAERELKFATCPRCQARNPVGVDEQKKESGQWRIGFIVAAAVLAAGIWFFPPLAWLLVAIDAIIVAIILYALRRVGGSANAKRSTAMTVAVFVGIVTTAILYPRGVSLFALFLVFQFARKKSDPDVMWEDAKTKMVFAAPYR